MTIARARIRVSVQSKLLGSFGLVVALMLGLGLFAVTRLGSENQHLTTLASKVVPSTRAVGEINVLMGKYRKDQMAYILAKPTDRLPNDLGVDPAKVYRLLRTYRAQGLIQNPAERRLLDSFRASFARYVVLTAPFKALADQGRISQATDAVGSGPGDAENDKLKAVIGAWSDQQVKSARAAETASQSAYHKSLALILALLALAVVIAVAVALVLARRTTRAVSDVAAAAKAISQGDIDQRVVVRSRDELGEMAIDFDSMIDYLHSTVGIAEGIAAGNLDVEVRPRSDRDVLGKALVAMTGSLRRLNAENAGLLAVTREEADTDALTALPNRRALMRDLETQLAAAGEERPLILALFDLDGFKQYNDTFGHPAGDVLLARLGSKLQQALEGSGRGYRMGGDEFCMLVAVEANSGAAIAARAAAALSEKGEGFNVSCSYGIASLPRDASTAGDALALADRRMYQRKAGRASASRQSTDVLLKALSERNPGLSEHTGVVAQLAKMTAEAIGLDEHETQRIELAGELHDIGKVAIPETILNKPGPLDEEEWEFMRRHTVIGARILIAAPSLAQVAELVRSSHERYDGGGYPDHLAGEDIPLGSSIIMVCDAFDAMTSARPYGAAISVSDALAELRRCSGSQFHPRVVATFCDSIDRPGSLERAGAETVGTRL
ncbi:MAG TPA: HD domain-containing phosphohydrolase [Solirubrobacteraceae bacterium]|nr:HD domain-containing phosphohydrolase [Solirubrobacteraceae bacterium]